MSMDAKARIRLSKGMSYLLRHAAEKEGIPISEDGFVKVSDALKFRRVRGGGYTPRDVEDCVAYDQANGKGRFKLEMRDGELYIRANQGHSMTSVKVDMQPVTSADEYPVVVHGSYMKNWEAIRDGGLNRMTRQHIHFALGEKGQVKSGMRGTCDLLIYIDLAAALADGIEFLVSANGVMLSPGVDGVIAPCYFRRCVDLRNSIELLPEHGKPLEDSETGGSSSIPGSKRVNAKPRNKQKKKRRQIGVGEHLAPGRGEEASRTGTDGGDTSASDVAPLDA